MADELTIGQVQINSNGDKITFAPASCRVSFESVAGANSGRTDDGSMKINWKARLIYKVEIALPPFSLDNDKYYGILSMVQGQEYTLKFFDPLSKTWRTEPMYTGNSASDFYSGVVLNGIIQGCSFNAIGMNSYYKVDSTHATAPIIPHVIPEPAPQLTAPVISLSTATVSWSAVSHASNYIVYDNGTEYTWAGTSYTITNTSINHNIKVKAIGSGYSDSNWSNIVTYVPTAGEYWSIHWDNYISTWDEEEGDTTWDVRHTTLQVSFTSNNQSFTSIHAGGEEEFLDYNNSSVYSYDQLPPWLNPNYQDIIMTVNPTTVFTGDWGDFLTENGTVTHHS